MSVILPDFVDLFLLEVFGAETFVVRPSAQSFCMSRSQCHRVQVETVEDLVVIVARSLFGVPGKIVCVGSFEIDQASVVAV